ncbi:MAG TPA: hypothetical protein VHF01_04700 [Candidatus Acidoferrum sp.]|nr:hypothetical protein [Candidatus Acidoferrum sp.]
MPAGLQLSLLYKIMGRLGELREESFDFLRNSDLYNLVPEYVQQNGEQKALQLLNRHLIHLSERGYVRLGPPTSEGFRAIWLTADGEMFLQPELAEFGQRPRSSGVGFEKQSKKIKALPQSAYRQIATLRCGPQNGKPQ